LKLLHCLVSASLLCCLSALVTAQSYPPAWSATSKYAVGDQVQVNGNIMRAIKPVTVAGKFVYSSWEMWEVRANTTEMVGVGQTFPTLQGAWSFIQNARIADGAFVHLYISSAHGPLSESFSGPLSLDHGSGAKISIIGDDPSMNTFTFPGDGMTLDNNHAIGLLSQITLAGGPNNGGTGVSVTGDSSVGNIATCTINGFAIGIGSVQGSNVVCQYDTGITAFSNTAGFANLGGTIVFNGGSDFNGTKSSIALQAAFGGRISAQTCVISGCKFGAEAFEGGVIDIDQGAVNGCAIGIEATLKGHVDAAGVGFGGGVANTLDVHCLTGATVECTGSNLSTKILGDADGSYVYYP